MKGRGLKVALFSRHLAVLFGAGVALPQALDILAEQHEDVVFATMIGELSQMLQSGHPLSQGLRRYPEVFPVFFVGLVQAGENTGSLLESLQRAAQVLESTEMLNRRVSSALTYPLFILAVTAFLTWILFKTVLPQFAEMFAGLGSQLPWPTRLLFWVSDCLSSPWFWVLGLLAGGALSYGLSRAWATPRYRLRMYRWLRVIPLVGSIIKYNTLARFCWVMQLTLLSGMDILKALHLSAEASNCPLLQDDQAAALRHIRDGEAVSQHMAERPEIYPRLLVQMAQLSEEASDYASGFRSSAHWFEQEVDVRIDLFKAALEPLLMAGVSLIVGSIMLCIFLPLYGILDRLGG
ncbi:type II secretion system F family protein [bacterium]|nr:type II secretion system F family protein [bacterium]